MRTFIDDVTGISFHYNLQQVYSDGGYHCNVCNAEIPIGMTYSVFKSFVKDCVKDIAPAPVHSFNGH